MPDGALPIIDGVDDATDEWLSTALGHAVTRVSTGRVGAGQIGSCYRLGLAGEGVPGSVLLKLPTDELASREMLAGTYRVETRFYAELLPRLSVRAPECFAATGVADDGRFALLLEDLAPAVAGDQLSGCTPAEAALAAENLAGLHAPLWCDPSLLELDWISASGPDDATMLAELYGPTAEAFIEQVGSLIDADTAATIRAGGEVIEAWMLARSDCFGPVHGDYRLDNLLFTEEQVWAVDWQTLSIGLPLRDLAYLLGTGLSVEDRRAHERAIVARYHAALVGQGTGDYSAEQCWDDYCLSMLQGPLVTIFGCAYGKRSERGDRMFAAMAQRSCAAIRDLDTLRRVGPN